MKILSLLLVALCFGLHAQVNDTKWLDHNNVSAVIGDEGVFFSRSSLGLPGYEVPKGSGKSTIFSGSIWVGAEDINGSFYVSGTTYTGSAMSSAMHSGPIAYQPSYQTLSYHDQYSESIWKISRQEIDDHIQNYSQPGYVAPQSILDWPGNGDVSLGVAHDLAPYIDVNNDGMYTPMLGDYPEVRGDEAVYVIVNDKSYNPDSDALGIEVHLMFYQYNSGNYLNNATFLHAQVFNRSTIDYHNFKEALYLDFDIGNYGDDYIGCDSTNHVAFAYNGDDLDEDNGGNIGYGVDPPCQGVVSLSHDLDAFGYYSSSIPPPYIDYQQGDTTMWLFMNAMWQDSTHWTYGGYGYNATGATYPTNYIFNGNPYTNTGWFEENALNGNPTAPGDRRGVFTISEDQFPSGAAICSDFAFIYDKSGTRLHNVQNVINIAASLRQLYSYEVDYPCNTANFNAINEQEEDHFELFPNPSKGVVSIVFDNSDQKTIKILSVSGEVVDSFIIKDQKVTFDLSSRPGIYFVLVDSKKGRQVEKLIIE